MLVKYTYTVFIGILFATFIGVGIAAFYTSPKSPEYPGPAMGIPSDTKNATPSAEYIRQQEEFNQKQKDYQQANNLYNRNVSVLALIASRIVTLI